MIEDIFLQLEEIESNVREIKSTWGNTITTLDNIKTSLKADHQKAKDDAYQRGLEDGKAQAERGCDGCQFEGTEIYLRPCSACRNAYHNQWTAKKSIDSEFNVGDEVQLYDCSPTSLTGVVLPPLDNDACRVMWSDASIGTWDKDILYKTGRRFNISETLEKMKGSENR